MEDVKMSEEDEREIKDLLKRRRRC